MKWIVVGKEFGRFCDGRELDCRIASFWDDHVAVACTDAHEAMAACSDDWLRRLHVDCVKFIFLGKLCVTFFCDEGETYCHIESSWYENVISLLLLFRLHCSRLFWRDCVKWSTFGGRVTSFSRVFFWLKWWYWIALSWIRDCSPGWVFTWRVV